MSNQPELIYDLRTGFPHMGVIPRVELARIAADLFERDSALQYTSDRAGDPWTREQLARWLGRITRHDVIPDELHITAGGIPGIDQVARYATEPGDIVLVENPTFYYLIHKLELNHVEVMGVPMQPDGIDLDALEAICQQHGERISLFYVIPTFHNPTGYTYSDKKRRGLVELAQKYDFIVAEDVTYQELYFDANEPSPPMLLDYNTTSGHIVTIGSFSKLISPSLRIGWIWSKPEVADRLPHYKTAITSAFMSQLVGEMIARDTFDAQIQHARQFYGDKYRLMIDALHEFAPPGMTWTEPNGGYFIQATLPEGVDATPLRKVANAQGIDFMPGKLAYVRQEAPDNTIRLCFALQEDDVLVKGVKALSGVIRTVM